MSQETSAASSRFDWGDAIDVCDFYGREAERLLLEQWVVKERCQVVSVLGMGGIVMSVAWSPDGTRLASGRTDGGAASHVVSVGSG